MLVYLRRIQGTAPMGLMMVLGCSSGVPPTSSGGTGGTPMTHAYEMSPCGVCVTTACAATVTTCGQDPECAASLACLYACPLGPTGDALTSCASACPTPADSAGLEALASVQTCRAAADCVACGNVAPDAGVDPVLDQVCAGDTSTDLCTRCHHEKCCDTDAACNTNSECTAIVDCILALLNMNVTDFGSCYSAHPTGMPIFSQRMTCRDFNCSNTVPCQGDGGMPSICFACEYQRCPETFSALEGNPEGYMLWQCIQSCAGGADLSCIDACESAHPDAVLAVDAWITCSVQRCSIECSG